MREIEFIAYDKSSETYCDVSDIGWKFWHDSNEINYIKINGLGTDGTEERDEMGVDLLQFTGARDTKDCKIYDGDRLKLSKLKEGRLGKESIDVTVYWFEEQYQWWIKEDYDEPNTETFDYSLDAIRWYELIERVPKST